MRHVFMECRNAVLFWNDLQTSLDINLDLDWADLKCLVAGQGTEAHEKQVIMGIALHAVWEARTARVECLEDAKPTWLYLKRSIFWVASLVGKGQLENEPFWLNMKAKAEK